MKKKIKKWVLSDWFLWNNMVVRKLRPSKLNTKLNTNDYLFYTYDNLHRWELNRWPAFIATLLLLHLLLSSINAVKEKTLVCVLMILLQCKYRWRHMTFASLLEVTHWSNVKMSESDQMWAWKLSWKCNFSMNWLILWLCNYKMPIIQHNWQLK